MGLVTVYCPLTMTGTGKLVFQAAGERFVVDSKVNPITVFVHVNTTFVPERKMLNCGGVGGSGKERLNTVPLPELPPPVAVP